MLHAALPDRQLSNEQPRSGGKHHDDDNALITVPLIVGGGRSSDADHPPMKGQVACRASSIMGGRQPAPGITIGQAARRMRAARLVVTRWHAHSSTQRGHEVAVRSREAVSAALPWPSASVINLTASSWRAGPTRDKGDGLIAHDVRVSRVLKAVKQASTQ